MQCDDEEVESLEAVEDDSLIDELLQSNPGFQGLLAKSEASRRKPFAPSSGD